MYDNEFKFIANEILEYIIPKDKSYLSKYFKSDIQREFLIYFLVFGEISKFAQHTGRVVSFRWLCVMRNKLRKIQRAHDVAKANFDLERLTFIENGKYKYKRDE